MGHQIAISASLLLLVSISAQSIFEEFEEHLVEEFSQCPSDIAGEVEFEVLRLSGATEEVFWGTTSPYIQLTLHDGLYDEGEDHRGQSVKTGTKDHAGGRATYNELFLLNKPSNMKMVRLELLDSSMMGDSSLGSSDINLNQVYRDESFLDSWVNKKVTFLKDGEPAGFLTLRVKVRAL